MGDGRYGPWDGKPIMPIVSRNGKPLPVEKPEVHLAGGVRGTLCGSDQAKSFDPKEVTCAECVKYLQSMGQRDV